MKFLISLFLTLEIALASPIVISYEGKKGDAEIFLDILKKDYLIPPELMTLISTGHCERLKAQGKLDLCIKNNGDLYVVSVDRSFIEESLKVFRAP